MVAAFRERVPAAEEQEATAPSRHEVRDHVELIVREEARLHASEDQRTVAEQLFPGLRETGLEFLGAIDVQAQEFTFGGSLKNHDLEVVVFGDRTTQELHLPARLPLEVEDLFRVAHDVYQRVPSVVLRYPLPLLNRDLESE